MKKHASSLKTVGLLQRACNWTRNGTTRQGEVRKANREGGRREEGRKGGGREGHVGVEEDEEASHI
jgi:hypothetical protein